MNNPFLNLLIAWSDGNPGAAVFLSELNQGENLPISLGVMAKLERCKSIRGTNLYVLYNDLCNKDFILVSKLCTNCPDNVLEDACSRQDYSGKELIEKYLQ